VTAELGVDLVTGLRADTGDCERNIADLVSGQCRFDPSS
jgi:hypothetical protein